MGAAIQEVKLLVLGVRGSVDMCFQGRRRLGGAARPGKDSAAVGEPSAPKGFCWPAPAILAQACAVPLGDKGWMPAAKPMLFTALLER